MNRATRLTLLAAFLLALAGHGTLALAQVEVTLPLQGYFRPGHYMPVSVEVHAGAPVDTDLVLSAADGGAVPTHWRRDKVPPPRALLPLLPVRSAPLNLRWSIGNTSGPAADAPIILRPLADDERLVGFAAPVSADAGRALFPDKTVIPVTIGSLESLIAVPGAWNALDALVLDETSAATVGETQLAELFAGGTVVAVRIAKRPGREWLWTRSGAYWVTRPDLAGPSGAVSEAAYLPTQGWNPGRSDPFRRNVVVAGVLFAIGVLALCLWRSRLTVVAVVATSAALAVGLAVWSAGAPTQTYTYGPIAVLSAGGFQFDHWTYPRVLAPGDVQVRWDRTTRPVFASQRHFEHLTANGLRLTCGPNGRPLSFDLRLLPDFTLAVLDRSLRPPTLPSMPQFRRLASPPVTSPMRLLVEAAYLGPKREILGQTAHRPPGEIPEGSVSWPVVIIDSAPR